MIENMNEMFATQTIDPFHNRHVEKSLHNINANANVNVNVNIWMQFSRQAKKNVK